MNFSFLHYELTRLGLQKGRGKKFQSTLAASFSGIVHWWYKIPLNIILSWNLILPIAGSSTFWMDAEQITPHLAPEIPTRQDKSNETHLINSITVGSLSQKLAYINVHD